MSKYVIVFRVFKSISALSTTSACLPTFNDLFVVERLQNLVRAAHRVDDLVLAVPNDFNRKLLAVAPAHCDLDDGVAAGPYLAGDLLFVVEVLREALVGQPLRLLVNFGGGRTFLLVLLALALGLLFAGVDSAFE